MEEMDLNDTFGELNPSNLLNLDDDGAETEAEPEEAEVEVQEIAAAAAAEVASDALDISEVEPRIGMEFESDEAAKEFYIAYATRLGFCMRMNKSRRSRKDDTVIMRRFVCTKEGFHSKRVIYDDGKKKRKRTTAREGCMAMIEVVKKDPHGRWYVSKLVTEHTHHIPAFSMQSLSQLQGKVNDGNDNNDNNASISFGGAYLKSCSSNSNKVVRINPFGEGGEAWGLLEYLKGRQASSPGFFYAVQVDNNSCVNNVFWADAKARMAYSHFGDAVTFDTTYKKTKYMMPFACFRGVNHHLQSVNFGCCLLMDETKGSYIWLFETWLSAMGGSHPPLLITDRDKHMEGAISKVFPNTSHKFCQSHILSRCKHKLSEAYLTHASLKSDLKGCVTGSASVEEFETRWEHLLNKYNLWDNAWLYLLYQIRYDWVNVYQKVSFFPDRFVSQRQESLNKFFKRNFNAKTSLMVFINCFDQDMASRREKEAEADFTSIYTKPILKSPSAIEKQAAEVYTRAVFDIFQEEFVQSLGYYVDKVEGNDQVGSDDQFTRYTVAREEEGSVIGPLNFVSISTDDVQSRASCTCSMLEYSGILCRHVIRVFFTVGVRTLPQEYIFPRWTKYATTSTTDSNDLFSLNEGDRISEEAQGAPDWERMVGRYNELCRDGVRFGIEGSGSQELYKVAKSALERAFAEVLNETDVQRKEQQLQQQQHSMSRLARVQKMQQQHQHSISMPRLKVALPKFQLKKTPAARVALQEDTATE
ncbi:Protein FAR1-RELATED SEQUENCE 5 [Rhynchospora pubera]|uniref:Protein FAR1-RELATED SEQUENCE n=1 Tax=Rhynchospora pubera TaxID=906938 RepID=A0AAV8EF98_9POAL|nr:Protein FAR1-RELATED SEQUENCE 5 [Rhynchospora pubera]